MHHRPIGGARGILPANDHASLTMIVLERRNGEERVFAWTESPSIYFDTWALTRFARDATYQTRFFNLFKDRGTLLFSLMNVAEIGLYAGSEWPEMRSFLEKIGPHLRPLGACIQANLGDVH